MKKVWKSEELGDLCDIQLGGTPPRKVSRYWDECKKTGNVWLSIADIPKATFSSIVTSKEYLSDDGAEKVRLVKKGTLLFSFKLSIGRVCFAGCDLRTNEAIAALTLKASQQVDKKYLAWFLWGQDWDEIAADDEKLKGKTLNKAKLKKVPVIVPPLSEQKRIVAILDEAFAGIDTAIANTEKNLANARELFESYLSSVFNQRGEGWAALTLREVCKDYGRGKSKHRPRNDPKLFGGKYPFIQTGDVRNSDHLIMQYSTTYNESGLAQSKLWPKGTICITIAANIAETGILNFDACFPDSIIGLVIDETKVSKIYVEFLLQSVRNILKAKGKGSAQDNINLATFENERFPFPPLKDQLEFVERLQEIRLAVRQLESIYQQKLAALAELKQSLLQKAFSGELTADAADAVETVETELA
tara:strand:- start:27393 stop:28643 length:1251 start_codon:yes stop_codon:yes gene_type:complete